MGSEMCIRDRSYSAFVSSNATIPSMPSASDPPPSMPYLPTVLLLEIGSLTLSYTASLKVLLDLQGLTDQLIVIPIVPFPPLQLEIAIGSASSPRVTPVIALSW